jgi:hypothetical protein
MKKTKLHDELFETAEPVRITWKQLEQKWRHRWQIPEWATRGGFWRSQMSKKYLERKGYGSRWAVESFFSGLKRTMGSTLTSRKPSQLMAEAAFKVLAYTLRR